MRKLNMWLWGLLSAVSLGVSACAQVPQQETAAVVSTESHVADRVLAGTSAFDLAAVPAYSGQPYIVVHDNEPYFADTQYQYEEIPSSFLLIRETDEET